MQAAWDGDRIVGGAGAFTYRLSVPGGSIPAGGVTVVGVLPTHRRRGVLTAMMRAQLADSRARGEAAAYLWASEATIYGRFGYGLASRIGAISLARDRAVFAVPFESRGNVRLLDLEDAAAPLPAALRAGLCRAPRHVRAQQGLVGDSQAQRRPGAPPRRSAAPRSAGARRRARRLCAVPGRTGLGVRLQQGNGDDPGGRRADARVDAGALAVAVRLRLDVAVRRRPAPDRPSALPAAGRAAADAVQGQRRRLGAPDRHRSGAVGPQLRRRR